MYLMYAVRPHSVGGGEMSVAVAEFLEGAPLNAVGNGMGAVLATRLPEQYFELESSPVPPPDRGGKFETVFNERDGLW